MDYYYDINDHDEDDVPDISSPTSNNHHVEHSSPSLDNWRDLYETSVQSLRSDEDEQRASPVKPFYLESQTSIEQSPRKSDNEDHSIHDRRLESPISEIEPESNRNKSKWEIRLPELLNSMVGPDRQKREVPRRHTTNIVFQQSSESNSSPSQSNATQPIPPLVQKLRQKFDSLSTKASLPPTPPSTETKNRVHIPRYQRLSSLNGRGLTTERPVHRSRPALPIRPTPEITSTKSRSRSIASANFPPPTTTNHRSKVGPPVSYPKHYYPPPSTTSVVKQLIHNSGSLVYDSSTQKSSMKIPTLIKTPINLEQTREELRNTNADLTGRQLLPEHRKNKKNGHETSEHSKPRRSQSVDPLSNQ